MDTMIFCKRHIEYKGKDGVPVTLLWSYNYQCPVMKIVGATYNEMKSLSSYVALLGGRNYLPKSILQSIYDIAVSYTHLSLPTTQTV